MNILTSETITPPQPAADKPSMPEFGRWRDVQRLFGIKRGTLYNLMAEGKVKSVVLRRKGNVHGCRLIHLESVSQYLNGLMTDPTKEPPTRALARTRNGDSGAALKKEGIRTKLVASFICFTLFACCNTWAGSELNVDGQERILAEGGSVVHSVSEITGKFVRGAAAKGLCKSLGSVGMGIDGGVDIFQGIESNDGVIVGIGAAKSTAAVMLATSVVQPELAPALVPAASVTYLGAAGTEVVYKNRQGISETIEGLSYEESDWSDSTHKFLSSACKRAATSSDTLETSCGQQILNVEAVATTNGQKLRAWFGM